MISYIRHTVCAPMKIDSLDHLVLTVKDIKTTCAFYSSVLGMEIVKFGSGRTALSFGSQKINLHQQGNEFEPKAQQPTPGSADLCFITSVPLAEMVNHLSSCKVAVYQGSSSAYRSSRSDSVGLFP